MLLEYGFKAEDVIKEGRITEQDIERVREWKQQSVPNLTDEQIVNFSLSCDNNLEATKNTIIGFYKARSSVPELFSDRDVDNNQELQKQLKVAQYIVFPERTEEECAIIFHKICDTRYYKYSLSSSLKLLFMTLDAALFRYPPTGLIILIDMEGVGIMHLTRLRPYLLALFCKYLQEGLPVKLKAIHLLNTVGFIDKIMLMLQPFMSKRLYETFHFHTSDLDMETFYRKYIPKRCLPADYGGDLVKREILHEKSTSLLSDLRCFFDSEENQRKDVI